MNLQEQYNKAKAELVYLHDMLERKLNDAGVNGMPGDEVRRVSGQYHEVKLLLANSFDIDNIGNGNNQLELACKLCDKY